MKALTPRARVQELLTSVLVVTCVACGGGLPLLHPARTLASGDAQATVGFSENIATGSFATTLRNASGPVGAGTSGSAASDPSQAAAGGAIIAASAAPGVAPFVAARVGVGNHSEVGMTYAGRAMRADVRYAWELSHRWSLSAGAGATGVLHGGHNDAAAGVLDLTRLYGWGADAPVIVGYASDAELYMLWVGVRGGWEHVEGTARRIAPSPALPGGFDTPIFVDRLWAGGLLGVAAGFRHVHAALELDVAYASLRGAFGATSAQLSGVILGPAGALWWSF